MALTLLTAQCPPTCFLDMTLSVPCLVLTEDIWAFSPDEVSSPRNEDEDSQENQTLITSDLLHLMTDLCEFQRGRGDCFSWNFKFKIFVV